MPAEKGPTTPITLGTAAATAATAGKSNRKGTSTAMVAEPTAALRLRWLLLAFAPSSWLLAVTAYLTTQLAPVPLLWIIPLVLYLGSFIVVFARRPLVPHAWLVRVFPLSLVLLIAPILV